MKNLYERIMSVEEIDVEVAWRAVRHVRLTVYPPEGRVAVAAPLAAGVDAIRAIVEKKLPWIRAKRSEMRSKPPKAPRALKDGELVYYRGEPLRLRVAVASGRESVAMEGEDAIVIGAKPGSTPERRAELLGRWYKARLREALEPLVERWRKRLRVSVASWSVRKMKTRWGSCNYRKGRITFNLELVKKSPECIDYLVAHELAHLRVPDHGPRFVALMDKHVPGWKALRKKLNAAPLIHEEWDY